MSRVSCLTFFAVPFFVCVLFSNIFNYISIGSFNWVTIKKVDAEKNELVYTQYQLWDLSITAYSLIATGTALNILCLLLAFFYLVLLFLRKKTIKLLLVILLLSLTTCLLSILFNATGWYFFLVSLKEKYMCVSEFGWGYWLMTPSFGFAILAILFAALIIGLLFPLLHQWWKGDLRSGTLRMSSRQQRRESGVKPVYNITNHNNIIHRDHLTQEQIDGIKIDTKVDIPNRPLKRGGSRQFTSYDDYFNYERKNKVERHPKLNYAVVHQIPFDDSFRISSRVNDDYETYSYRDEYYFDERRKDYFPKY